MIQDPLAITVVLAIVVLIAVKLDARFVKMRSLGPALVAILLGMLLSNLGILPGESIAYSMLGEWGVNLGFALVLLSVDLRTVFKAGPKMLGAFLLGAAGTASGALVAALLLHTQIGPETWKLSGQYTGTYTGGGMNFAALGRAFETSSDLFSAAIAADVTMTAIWMAVCLLVPAVLGRKVDETLVQEGASEQWTLERSLKETSKRVELLELVVIVPLALGAIWFAGYLGGLIPAIPEVLWLTTVVVAMAQLPVCRRLPGPALAGNYLILLFLAGNGAQSVLANIVSYGPAVFYFAVIVVGFHGIVTFGAGRLLGFDMGTLAVASQANVGGAASAMAIATARNYGDRLLPGIAVSLLGYAVGNYMGFVVASILQSVL